MTRGLMNTRTPIPVRLQRSRGKDADNSSPNGLRVQYVGRPGRWGNTWKVCSYTTLLFGGVAIWWLEPEIPHNEFSSHEDAARVAVSRFEESLTDEQKAQARTKLRGKNLSCWCRLCDQHRKTGLPLGGKCPDCDPCHADVLLGIANEEAECL